jgi:hypothetical protein
MASGTITISGQATGLEGGAKTYGPLQIASNPANTLALANITTIVLASGNNTITIPTGANGCIVNFAPGSTVTKTYKGVATDAGTQIATTGVGLVLSWVGVTAPATFVIACSATDTNQITEIWFE